MSTIPTHARILVCLIQHLSTRSQLRKAYHMTQWRPMLHLWGCAVQRKVPWGGSTNMWILQCVLQNAGPTRGGKGQQCGATKWLTHDHTAGFAFLEPMRY